MTKQAKVTDIETAVDELITESVESSKPKPKAKAKAKSKAKAKETEPKEEPRAEAPKPKEPVTFKGFELKDDVDVKALEEDSSKALKAIEAISDNDANLLDSYLAFGSFASKAKGYFKSTKLFGQFLAKEAPKSQAMDAALRSNCKWLWEALNVEDHEASNLLKVLKVNRIEDFKSANPTVIKREFKKVLKEEEVTKKAEALGIDAEDAQDAAKKVKEKEDKAQQTKLKTKQTKAIKRFVALVNEHKDEDDKVEEIRTLLRQTLVTEDAMDLVLSY